MFCVRQPIFLALFLLALSCRAAPPYGAGTAAPGPNNERSEPGSGRKLRGKFLQITDVHPDPFYKTYSATDEEAACHRGRGPAGIYGAETSDCDTPLSLVNQTFKWIAENIKDEIDFVVWTGDSARHDNDEKIPRSQAQILEQNELLVQKFTEVFGKDDNINDTDPTNDFILPIVPTFGNNDIMPHNIFLSGPNKWTLKYLSIWKSFIPEAQRHQFAQGGWFSVEVIPNKLAVISLNTLYFFASNSGVDGCAAKSEPGYEHMEWLRIQLQLLRERGMKAILMGHVPPARVSSKSSWEETCWQKYTLWTRQYRDVITASLYGHMNIDHFMLQDFKDLKKSTKKGAMKSMGAQATMLEDGELTTASASSYLRDLRDEWAKLPAPPNSFALSKDADIEEEPFSLTKWFLEKLWTQKKQGKKAKKSKGGKGKKDTFFDKIGGRYGERFSVTLVSPSVVPNYFPTLRIYEYNITGLDEPNIPLEDPLISPDESGQHPLEVDDLDVEYQEEIEDLEKINRKGEKTTKKKKKYKFKVPKPPSKSSPPGPAYSPQTFTLLGYTQYFANLTHINNDFIDALSHMDEDESMSNATRWKHGKHHGKERKHNKPHPKKFKFQVEYDTHKDKIFKLKDLTVRSYIDLARRIGASQSKSIMVDNHDRNVEDYIGALDDELEEAKTGDKKKDGKKKKKKKHGKKNTWYTFVKRAFVGTLDPESIEEQFGTVEGSNDSVVEEMVEL